MPNAHNVMQAVGGQGLGQVLAAGVGVWGNAPCQAWLAVAGFERLPLPIPCGIRRIAPSGRLGAPLGFVLSCRLPCLLNRLLRASAGFPVLGKLGRPIPLGWVFQVFTPEPNP